MPDHNSPCISKQSNALWRLLLVEVLVEAAQAAIRYDSAAELGEFELKRVDFLGAQIAHEKGRAVRCETRPRTDKVSPI